MRSEQQARGEGIGIDAQAAAHGYGRARRASHCVLDSEDQRVDVGVEKPAFVREVQGARRPVEESHADARFKPRDRAADSRRRQAKGFGGPREAASFDDGSQHTYVGENSSVEGHGRFVISYHEYYSASSLYSTSPPSYP